MTEFLKICSQIGFPIAMEKTEWATEILTFLGVLLDGKNFVLSIPLEKKNRAEFLIKTMLSRNKVTVKELQTLCGFLHSLGKAIFPGHAFTRRMYAKYSKYVNYKSVSEDGNFNYNTKLKQHHHMRLDVEFKRDCEVWLEFLGNTELAKVVARPMVYLSEKLLANEIMFYSDASAAKNLGFGCIYNDSWIFGMWGENFMKNFNLSTECLELFGLCTGILTWQEELRNSCIIVFCDNQAVVSIVNNITSSCPNCSDLIKLKLLGLMENIESCLVHFLS